MNAIRIVVAMALAPLMVVGFVAFFVLRGLRGGYDLGRTALDLTDPFA